MAEKKPTETPMMKQFFAMKAQHPEAVLLFRCGDFYETYGDDALIAKILYSSRLCSWILRIFAPL